MRIPKSYKVKWKTKLIKNKKKIENYNKKKLLNLTNKSEPKRGL